MEVKKLKCSSYKYPNEIKQKTDITLTMACYIERLLNMYYYVCSNVLEVSTETKCDVASGKFKGAHNIHAG